MIALFVLAGPVRADSWADPIKRQYLSANKQWRLTVVPRRETGLGYFTTKVENKPLAGGKRNEPRATLHRRDRTRWVQVWQAPLVNEVAPPDALVSDNGQHIVTLGNWYMSGPGPNVVVIYGPDGTLVRSFALSDLLSEGYVTALPHSVSSIDWQNGQQLSADGREVVLAINAANADFLKPHTAFRLAIDLATGRPRIVDPGAWCTAQAAVPTRLAAMTAAEEESYRYLTEPLIGTGIDDEGGWQEYLWEAVARLGPLDEDGDPPSAWRTVLRRPSAMDYAISEKWVRDSLNGEAGMGELSFAALDPAALVTLFQRLIPVNPRGALKGKPVWVFLPRQYHSAVAAAFAVTGAKLVLHDPAVPIPHRPNRLTQLARPTDYRKLDMTAPVSTPCPTASGLR